MKRYGFYDEYERDLKATMQEKLKNNHDTISEKKDNTIEQLKGKKQLEVKHDVTIKERTANIETLRKAKEESQSVLKTKKVETKEIPKQINADHAEIEDKAIENLTKEKHKTIEVPTKKSKIVDKAIISSKLTSKMKGERTNFVSLKNIKLGNLNRTIRNLEIRLLKAKRNNKKLAGSLKKRSKDLTSQLDETDKSLAKVTKENDEYKTKMTKLTETNSKLEAEGKKLKEEVDIKDIQISDYESKYGNFVKETTEISQNFTVNKIHYAFNEFMSSLNQVKEEFDKDAERKNLGPKVSDFAKAFSNKVPDISFLADNQNAKSIKRKRVTPVQCAKKQKRA